MVFSLDQIFGKKKRKAENVFDAATVVRNRAADHDLHLRAESFIEALRRGEYDFIDLGTCDGGGFEIAARQGARKGLGFDLEPLAVRRSLEKGLDVALYDICELQNDRACVDFAVCSHILEHLPSPAHVERLLRSLSVLCRDYLLISGPAFEDEDYLEKLGLKVLHSLMLDHTCKIKVRELQLVLQTIGCRDYVVALGEPLMSSANHWVYNSAQPVPHNGLWTYDPDKHLPKAAADFDRPIHRDFVCVVPLRAGISSEDVLRKFYWGFDKIVARATWNY